MTSLLKTFIIYTNETRKAVWIIIFLTYFLT